MLPPMRRSQPAREPDEARPSTDDRRIAVRRGSMRRNVTNCAADRWQGCVTMTDMPAPPRLSRRRIVAWSLAVAALLLYLADLMGLKPPPRILPSLVLVVVAVLIGLTPRARPADRPQQSPDRALVIAGLTLQLLLFVPILPIGLVAPGAGVLVIHGLWLVGLIVAWWLRRSDPPIVLAVPFVTAALIGGVLWFGTTVLGWRP
jgi:hypothetical protein